MDGAADVISTLGRGEGAFDEAALDLAGVWEGMTADRSRGGPTEPAMRGGGSGSGTGTVKAATLSMRPRRLHTQAPDGADVVVVRIDAALM